MAVTAFCSVVLGVWQMEDHIKKTINESIDGRLNMAILKQKQNEDDITLLKIAAKRSDDYATSTSYRLNYHEIVMRDMTNVLHNHFSKEFISPNELRFEDFKKQ